MVIKINNTNEDRVKRDGAIGFKSIHFLKNVNTSLTNQKF